MSGLNQQVYRVKKVDLANFVDSLKTEGEVIGPKFNGVEIAYLPVEDGSEIDLSKIPLDNPKNYVFPITERVLEVKGSQIHAPLESKKRVLFGIRPCDVAAIKCLKTFFEDYAKEGRISDPLVMSKLKGLTIVAYNCPEPKEHCFCSAMDAGPAATADFDIALSDLGNSYLVESGSLRGEGILKRLKLARATIEDVEKKIEVERRCIEKMNASFSVEGIENRVLKRVNEVVAKYGKMCIECGGCNFVCPTCTCFNVSDIVDAGVIRRERAWDSCLYRGFTWLAGGVFERASIDSRMKQRILHKLVYTKEHFNAYSCTGCGRCSQTCPSYICMDNIIGDILAER